MKPTHLLIVAMMLCPCVAAAQPAVPASGVQAPQQAATTEKPKEREIFDVSPWSRTVPTDKKLENAPRNTWGRYNRQEPDELQDSPRNPWRADRSADKEKRRFGQERFKGPYNIIPRRRYPSPARRD